MKDIRINNSLCLFILIFRWVIWYECYICIDNNHLDLSRIFSGLNGRTVTVLLDDVFWRKQSFNSIVNCVKTVSDNHSAKWSLPIFLKQFATVRKLFSLPTVLFHVVSKDKQGWSVGNSCSKKKKKKFR